MSEKEIFRDIPDYEGKYQISNEGRVFNKLRNTELKQYPKDGYMTVSLYNESGRKTLLVHRLVAMTFLENPYMLPEVNHKDEIRNNNNIENLEWCTSKYNSNYGTHNQKLSRKNSGRGNPFFKKKHSFESIQKMSIKKKGQPSKRRKKVIANGIVYDSMTDCAMQLGISLTQVYNLINGYRFSESIKINYLGDEKLCMNV